MQPLPLGDLTRAARPGLWVVGAESGCKLRRGWIGPVRLQDLGPRGLGRGLSSLHGPSWLRSAHPLSSSGLAHGHGALALGAPHLVVTAALTQLQAMSEPLLFPPSACWSCRALHPRASGWG